MPQGQRHEADVPISIPYPTNITGSNVVITWESGTDDSVVESVEATSNTITVYVKIEGGLPYKPTVTLKGDIVSEVPITNLTLIGDEGRWWSGSGQCVVNGGGGTVQIVCGDGGYATFTFVEPASPPSITVLTVGAPPGSQTRVANGNTVSFHVEWDATGADTVVIEDYELSGSAQEFAVSPAVTQYDGSFTVGGSNGNPHHIKAHMKLPSEAEGDSFESTNTLWHDSDAPDVPNIVVNSYPVGTALKNAEEAVATSDFSDYTTCTIDDNSQGEVEVWDGDSWETSINDYKPGGGAYDVRRAGGSYNISTNNLKLYAYKSSNDTSTTKYAIVRIVNVAAECTVLMPFNTKYRTNRNDDTAGDPVVKGTPIPANYTMRVWFNQSMTSMTSLTIPEGSLGSWAGSGDTFNATITVTEGTDARGTHTATAIGAVGLSGIAAVLHATNKTYKIGGFLERAIFFDPFQLTSVIGCEVDDTGNLFCEYEYSSEELAFVASTGDGGADCAEYTITTSGVYDPNGNECYLRDHALAGANTTGTLGVNISESET